MAGVVAGDDIWILGVRAAGALHFVTLLAACLTPIPPDWDANLARLPAIHRRFAVAQNVFIGAVIAFAGLISLGCAPELVAGTPLARMACGGIALWWGGRLAVLSWLGVRPHLTTLRLRIGFALLVGECVVYTLTYGWLAVRP
jgi:hypothetical protein